MNVSMQRLGLLSACGALLTTGIWFGRQGNDFSKVQEIAHPVAGTVQFLEGAGGNIGVCSGADGVLLIDDQFEPLAPKIQAALDGISKSPLRFVLNTHWHGDHTGGNPVFGRKAPILAQENVRVRLMSNPRGAMAPEGLPMLTYADGIRLHLNGEEIRVVHYDGGHTDGDSVIFFETSNVVHMGDLYFAGRFPYVDLDSGGSVRKLVADLDAILPQLKPDTKLIPGHGALSNAAELKVWRDALADCVKLVDDGLKSGKTAEQLKQAKVLDKYSKMSWDFVNADAFVDTIVRDR